MSEARRDATHAAGHAEIAGDHAASTTGAQCIDVAGGAQRRVTGGRGVQLALSFETAPTGSWTYLCGMPDRSGMSRFTHLIRWSGDSEETMARGAGNRDPLHWRKTKSVDAFVEGIRALMLDGEPRTFNRICIEMTGATSDVWLDSPIDVALWRLVASRELWWACEDGAVFFLHQSAVERDAEAA